MNLSNFLQLSGSNISLLLQIIAEVLFLAFVIPLQVRELNIKNGLAKLRKQLLLRGIFLAVVNGIAIVLLLLSSTLRGEGLQSVPGPIQILTLLYAASLLAVAIIDFKIYRQEYSGL